MIDDFLAMVDAEAEQRRAGLVTVVPGQMLAYIAKEAEARRFLADRTAGTLAVQAAYPWLLSEVGITAPATGDITADLGAVADTILAAAATFATKATAIEATRLTAKQAIRATTCAEEAATLITSLTWP